MSDIKTLNLCASFVFSNTLKVYNKRHFINSKQNIIINLMDDLSNGPIKNLDNDLNQRIEWAKRINDKFRMFMINNALAQDYNQIYALPNQIDKDTKIVIYYADNVLEKINYDFFINIFQDFDIYAVNAFKCCKIKYNKEIVRVINSAECNSKNIKVLNKNIVQLSENEKQNAINEWKEITNSYNTLRILENDKVINVAENYFDDILIKNLPEDFTSSLKICGKTMSEIPQYVSDQFLMYRLAMIAKDKKAVIKKAETYQEVWKVKKNLGD